MRFLSLVLIVSSWAGLANAGEFVKLDRGHEVYAEYSPAKSGKATVVLVNGLVYDLKRWDEYAAALKKDGVGVVRYYFRGQLKTLKKEVETRGEPKFFESGLELRDFSLELKQLLTALEIRGKVTVVGLSYGATIAAHFAKLFPEKVENLILMAPMVISLDHYDPLGAWVRMNLDAIRLWWGPLWGPQAYDYYYNLIYRSYLVDQRLTPDRIPDDVKDIAEEYKEAVFHQVRAVRDFDLRDYKFTAIPKVYLITGSKEDPNVLRDQFESWEGFNKDAAASLLHLKGAHHAIPDAAPRLAADLSLEILAGNKSFSGGKIYSVGERGKVYSCESLLALKTDKCK